MIVVLPGLFTYLFSSPSRAMCAFSSPVTFGGSVWVRAMAASSKGTVSSELTRFRADSETNIFKQEKLLQADCVAR